MGLDHPDLVPVDLHWAGITVPWLLSISSTAETTIELRIDPETQCKYISILTTQKSS